MAHLGGYDLSEKIRPHQGPKRATRLAAVAITWNLLRHFSPYLEPVSKAWEVALEQGLRDAATALDDATFLHGFRTFTAPFREGHIFPRMDSCPEGTFHCPSMLLRRKGRMVRFTDSRWSGAQVFELSGPLPIDLTPVDAAPDPEDDPGSESKPRDGYLS